MRKTISIIVLVIFVIALGINGIACKTKSETEESLKAEITSTTIEDSLTAQPTEATSSSQAQNNEIITLRLMMFPDNPKDEEYYDILIKEYEDLNPNIKITRESVPWNNFQEKLMPQVMADNPPDIARVSSQWGATYAAQGALADLNQFLKKEDSDKYQQGRLVTCMYDSKLFGLPETSISIGMWYNKTMVDKAGIKLPESPEEAWTWDEFKTVAKKVKETSKVEYGFDVYKSFFPYLTWIYSGGGSLLNQDLKTPNINSEKSVAAVKYLADIYKEGIAPVSTPASGDADAAQKLFQAGKVAFYYSGVWLTSTFVDSIKDFDFAATYLPYKEDEEPAGNASGENLIIFKKSKNIEAAYNFISWFTNKENTEKHLGYASLLSPRADTQINYEIRPDIMDVFDRQAKLLKIQWAQETHVSQFAEITPSLMDNLGVALTNNLDAQEAMNIVADEIESIMSK